jgi:hypothetical protein
MIGSSKIWKYIEIRKGAQFFYVNPGFAAPMKSKPDGQFDLNGGSSQCAIAPTGFIAIIHTIISIGSRRLAPRPKDAVG